jgi:hypothetical protein
MFGILLVAILWLLERYVFVMLRYNLLYYLFIALGDFSILHYFPEALKSSYEKGN